MIMSSNKARTTLQAGVARAGLTSYKVARQR